MISKPSFGNLVFSSGHPTCVRWLQTWLIWISELQESLRVLLHLDRFFVSLVTSHRSTNLMVYSGFTWKCCSQWLLLHDVWVVLARLADCGILNWSNTKRWMTTALEGLLKAHFAWRCLFDWTTERVSPVIGRLMWRRSILNDVTHHERKSNPLFSTWKVAQVNGRYRYFFWGSSSVDRHFQVTPGLPANPPS